MDFIYYSGSYKLYDPLLYKMGSMAITFQFIVFNTFNRIITTKMYRVVQWISILIIATIWFYIFHFYQIP